MKLNYKRSAFRYGFKKYIIKNKLNNKHTKAKNSSKNSRDLMGHLILVIIADAFLSIFWI